MQKIKKQTFFQGIITLMFSQIIIKILGLIYKLYLTNKQGFGDTGNAIYSSGFQIYALLLTISSVGVPNAVSKLVSEKSSIGDYKGAQRIFKISFFLFSFIGFLVSIILFFSSKYIANILLQIPEAELTLKVLAPSIFFVSVISVLRGYFNGKENMKPTANSQAIEQLAKTIFTIILVEIIFIIINIENKTAIMAASASLATSLATILGLFYLFRYYKKDKIESKMNKSQYKKEKTYFIIKNIFLIAMPMTITAILGSVNKSIDSFTVVRGLKNFLSLENAQIQYGILGGKVDTLITLPMSFNIALSTVLIPSIAGEKAKGNIKKVEERIRFSLLTTILIGLPCTVGMIVFAKPILNLLFPNASSGEFIYQISSISIIFIVLNQTINGILQGIGKQMAPVISLIIGVIIKLIINIILIPINPEQFFLGGTVGASVGTVTCYAISLLISLYQLKKNINVKIDIVKIIIKPLIATLVMIIISKLIFNILINVLTQKIVTIISILIAIIIYVLVLFLIKIFNKKELEMIKFYKNI